MIQIQRELIHDSQMPDADFRLICLALSQATAVEFAALGYTVQQVNGVLNSPQVQKYIKNNTLVYSVPDPAIKPELGAIIVKPVNNPADRIRASWEETGVLPKIPMEFQTWAAEDIGQNVINAYRKSGRITTTQRGDIVPGFALYVGSQNPGKDIDYAYAYIRKLELDPSRWEILSALVMKWQASLQSNHEVSIVREVSRKPLPKIKL